LKKILIPFFVFMLLLCGCNSKKEIEINTASVSFYCKATVQNEKYEFSVVADNNPLKMECTAIFPSELKGMTFTVSKNGIIEKYLGLETQHELVDMPRDNLLRLLFDFFENAKSKKAYADKGNYRLDGNCADTYYSVYVSPNGSPLSLETEDGKIKMEFSKFTLVK